MKLWNRLICFILSCAMLAALCACSGGQDVQPSPTPTPTPEATPSDTGFTVDTSVEDLTLAVMGVPGDFELLSINGTPIQARLYMYWLSYYMAYLESMGYDLNLETDSDLADYLKSDALNTCIQYGLIAAKMEELDCSLSQEQINALESNITLYKAMAGGEEAFNETLRQTGLDYDTYYLLSAVSYYVTALQEQLFPDAPTDDELKTYIEEHDILYAKHILLMTIDPSTNLVLDEATVAQKKATAEDILNQLRSSSDLPGDFDALMNRYSEDTGLAAYPNGYIFTANEMVQEFETATRNLEYGQISDLVKSSFGYHIILRLDPADADEVTTSCQSARMDEQISTWLEQSDIILSDEFGTLDPVDFYNKYSAYTIAFSELENASGEGAE